MLEGPFQVFSSTFYASMDALGLYFKIPSFNILYEHITWE